MLNASSEYRQRRKSSEGALSLASESASGNSDIVSGDSIGSGWSVLYKLPLFSSGISYSEQFTVTSDPKLRAIEYTNYNPNSEFEVEWALTSQVSEVNKPEVEGEHNTGGWSSFNSTNRYNYSDREDAFLTVSSSLNTDTSEVSDMSDKEDGNNNLKSCKCTEGKCCAVCSASGAGDHGIDGFPVDDLMNVMNILVNKVNAMATDMTSIKQSVKGQASDMTSIRQTVKGQAKQIRLLEDVVSGGSEQSDNNTARKGKKQVKINVGGERKPISKHDRVLEEKERQLNMLLDRLHEKEKNKIESQSDTVESSDDELNLGRINKKRSSKQK